VSLTASAEAARWASGCGDWQQGMSTNAWLDPQPQVLCAQQSCAFGLEGCGAWCAADRCAQCADSAPLPAAGELVA